MARWHSTITLDQLADELRQRFPDAVFLRSEVKSASIPGLMNGAAERYLGNLHERGDISCAESGGGYKVNKTPTPCIRCAKQAQKRAEEAEEHLLPADVARDIKDIQRVRSQLKGTRLGDQIEALFSELKAHAETCRRFKQP